MGSCYIDKVLKIANDWLGYEEGANNWTIFAKVLDEVNYFNTPKQNVAWCGTFDYFCILQACIPEDRDNEEKKWDALYFTYQPSKENLACGCRYGADYFRENGAWYSAKEAKRGDIIFFGPRGAETHQGLVEKVENGRIYTIEGNKGDKVANGDYSVNYTHISGVGRPRYDGEEEPKEEKPEEPAATPEKPEEPSGKPYTVCVNSFLNIRTGAGLNYPSVWKLYNGDEVIVYEEESGWGKIKPDEDLWVCMKYLK